METKFTSGEAISFGWEKMKKHFWFFVGLLILVFLIQAIPSGISNHFKDEIALLVALIGILAWVLQLIVKMGMIRISLDIVDKDKAEIKTLFSQTNIFFRFLFGSILYGLIVSVGFFLLIVPGIIWAIKYQFFAYLIIDKNLGPIEAIRKSGEITMGSKGKLFWFGLLLGLINIAGAICLLVGLFATVPTTMMAYVYVYRKLLGESTVAQSVAAPLSIPAEPQV